MGDQEFRCIVVIYLTIMLALLGGILGAVITRIKHNSMYKDDRRTADYIIKALEQQSNEDCVSRQAVKEGMIKYGFHASDMTVAEFVEDELPPVTPKIPTSDDCVSRADLLAQINESWETIETKLDFVNIVKALPSVTSKVPTLDDCVSRKDVIRIADQGQVQGFKWQIRKLMDNVTSNT